ncbi:MAG TPA: hypothetical protein VI959_03130 [Alphaproteobacteria bacterium]|nr:hypothetical protein [Alphaproteobacteria bacterium]
MVINFEAFLESKPLKRALSLKGRPRTFVRQKKSRTGHRIMDGLAQRKILDIRFYQLLKSYDIFLQKARVSMGLLTSYLRSSLFFKIKGRSLKTPPSEPEIERLWHHTQAIISQEIILHEKIKFPLRHILDYLYSFESLNTTPLPLEVVQKACNRLEAIFYQKYL